MSENKKENLKYALAYIPLAAFFFYFIEESKSEEFKKHIKYAIVLFLGYVVLSIVFRLMWLYFLIPLLFIAYLIISGILAYKAYSGEEVEVEILDEIGDKLQEKIEGNNDKKEL